MLNRWLGFAVAAMVVLSVMGAGLRPAATGRSESRPEVGYLAPEFTLQDLEGNPVSLSSLRGKVVFVNFWATWCGPCRLEMPEMKRLHEQETPDLVILAVNLTQTERSVDHVRAFMDRFSYRFQVPLDTGGATADLYRAVSIPTSYFIGPDGVIRVKHIGPMRLATMESYVKWAREAR